MGRASCTVSHCRKLATCACTQVIDEADRLLRQSYQDWLPFVVAATAIPPELGRSSAHARAYSGAQGQRVVRFVASATLTRDPAKLERLGLHAPRCIALGAADHRRATCPSHLARCMPARLRCSSAAQAEGPQCSYEPAADNFGADLLQCCSLICMHRGIRAAFDAQCAPTRHVLRGRHAALLAGMRCRRRCRSTRWCARARTNRWWRPRCCRPWLGSPRLCSPPPWRPRAGGAWLLHTCLHALT